MSDHSQERNEKDQPPRPTPQATISQRRKGNQRADRDPGVGLSTSNTPSTLPLPLPPPLQATKQSPFPVILPPGDDRFDLLQYNPANYSRSDDSQRLENARSSRLAFEAHSPSNPSADRSSESKTKRHKRHENLPTQKIPEHGTSRPTQDLVDRGMSLANRNTPDKDKSASPQNKPEPTVVILPSADALPGNQPDPSRPFEPLKRLHHTPEIVFIITRHLRLDDVLTLYAISRDFRDLANSRFTGLTQIIAKWKAPESAIVFHWAFFKSLCIKDPGFRPHPRLPNECRLVPSFKWLRFIYHREKVVQEIVMHMNEAGVRVPRAASKAIKNIWLLMDIPDNNRRISFVQSRWTDIDLLMAQMFIIKLDMRFCDPVDGKGQNKVRKMLLAQKSMTVLLDVLARRALLNQLDTVKMYVRWKWVPEPAHRQYPIFGIPPDEVGQLQYEGWGSGYPRKLTPIESLVIREACRRDLGLEDDLIDIMQWGYVEPHTGANKPKQNVPKRPWRLEDEYSSDEDEDDDGPENYLFGGDESVGEEMEFTTSG